MSVDRAAHSPFECSVHTYSKEKMYSMIDHRLVANMTAGESNNLSRWNGVFTNSKFIMDFSNLASRAITLGCFYHHTIQKQSGQSSPCEQQ